MKKHFEYYNGVIKPLEKKYNRICFLYSVFKFNFLFNKKKFYNKLLISYYKTIQNNDIAIHEFKNKINI